MATIPRACAANDDICTVLAHLLALPTATPHDAPAALAGHWLDLAHQPAHLPQLLRELAAAGGHVACANGELACVDGELAYADADRAGAIGAPARGAR